MTMKTSSGYSYEPALVSPPPQFPSGDISVGSTVRGNVAFEVPTGTPDLTFVYNALLRRGDIVSVKIR